MSRWSTGRAGRWLLRLAVALGLLLVVAAPVLRFWVTPLLAQSPPPQGQPATSTTTTTGTITSLFNLETGTASPALQPIPVTTTVSTTVDPVASAAAGAEGANVTVSDTTTRTATDDGRLIAELTYRLAADRHTQALVDCCGAQVGGVTPSAMAGAGSPLRLPWFVPQAPYPYFDVTLLAPVSMPYIGRDRVGDLDAMKFQQALPATAVGTVPVPGALVGSEQQTVVLTRTHSVTRTLWVDPTTGIVLRTADRVRDSLRDAAGKDVVTLLSMSTASPTTEVDARVAAAREEAAPVLWAHSYGPALCLGLGLTLLALALVAGALRTRSRRIEQDFPDEWATFDDLKEIVD